MKKIAFLLLVFFASQFIFARQNIPFNQDWAFKKGPFTTSELNYSSLFKGNWQLVQIPHTWNAVDMQSNQINAGYYSTNERFYVGDSYYRKTFVPKAEWKNKRIFIKFEGVGANAEVYVNTNPLKSTINKNNVSFQSDANNGTYNFVGRHQGGYSAFVLELTGMIKFDQENEILVKANNEENPAIIPTNHVLFPVYGGIYRPVSLIVTDPINIAVNDFASAGVYISQKNVSKKSADIKLKIKLDNKTLQTKKIEIISSIIDHSGKIVKTIQTPYTSSPQGQQEVFQDIKLTNPRLWNGLDDPYLYKVVTQIKADNQIIDEVTQTLGIRKFELKANEGFFLNDKKYPLYGVTRHQDRWGKGSALSNEDHDEDLAIIKEMGATSIRLAHYQQSDYFYSKCDSLGLIVWAEIPFVNQVTTLEENNALQQLKELIRQNYNHPSIYTWGLHNEVYSPTNYTIELTTKLNDLAKTEDPDRYTVQVSGYNVVDHPVNNNADVQGINHYFGWYNGEVENLTDKEDVETWANEISKKFKDFKIIFSEYGAEAKPEDQVEVAGNYGNQWSDPAFFPEEFATKFHIVHWATIEKHPIFLGSYVWNTFDFATPITRLNVNPRNYKGLVSFDRKIKKDPFYWYKANWSKEPVVYLTQRRMVNRGNEFTTITIFSNQGTPILTVNGKKIENVKNGYNKIHFIAENVQLQKGENTVIAETNVNGKLVQDKIIWNYDPKYKTSQKEATTKDIHVGL